jgi:hypothetical protein
MKKPKPTKGERVWVAVEDDGEAILKMVRRTRREVQNLLPFTGITIRRATLTLDPVPPRRPK